MQNNFNVKYGLMSYEESCNIGDEVQSIAAKQYLPRIDYLLERNSGKLTKTTKDDVNKIDAITEDPIIKVIYNGWFDGQYCKFPPPKQVEPLLISFHINELDHSNDKTFSYLDDKKIAFTPIATNKEYFKKYEPIGCRDLHTVNKLTQNGISAFFSGCLTLTLKNRFTLRNNEILVVDSHILCPKLFKDVIPDDIRSRASYISQVVSTEKRHDEKMRLAQNMLDRIAQAKLVITSRLHTAMPCLAFDTPVIFLHDDLEDVRFSGLLKFLKSYTKGTNGTSHKLDVNLNEFCKVKEKSAELQSIIDNLRATTQKWIGLSPLEQINSPSHYNYHDNNHALDGYSIFSVCMNRNHHLEQSLPTWLSTNANEIVIVDWGSQPPIKSIVDKYNASGKITLITITNVDKWVLTKSFNLAAQFTKYKYILKVDCDSLLKDNFFAYHNLEKNPVFFAGDWTKARNTNERHTNGIVYMKWTDFRKANYYNEYIVTYGYDDCDLYKRLEKHAKRLVINFDTVQHIEHSNNERMINQSLSYDYRLDVEIEKNRLISELHLWNEHSVPATFNIIQMNNNNNNNSNSNNNNNNNNNNEFLGYLVNSVELPEKQKEAVLAKAIKNREWAMKSNGKKKLYINVKNGLGNRLRALASGYNIARATNRQLILIWTPDNHCQVKFTDLYKVNYLFKDATIIENQDSITIADAIEYKVGENEYIVGDKVVYNYVEFKDKYIDDTTSNNIYVISACVLINKHTNWNKECDFLRRLEVVDDIAIKIYDFELNNVMPEIIGIHIRMGQSAETAKYEDTSHYTEVAKASINKWRSHSHWNTFIKEMDNIIKDNPKQVFFLCCDTEEAYKAILGLNKYNIVYIKKNVYDRSIEQLRSAVIDLVLLSKAKYILGSNWSSFTEIASRLSGKKPKLAGVDF
jgi:hypothetical protein